MPRPKIRLCDMPGFDCWKLGMLKSYSSDLLFDFETIYKLQSERFAEFMLDDFKREIEETICSLHKASAGLKVMNDTRIYLMTDFNQVRLVLYNLENCLFNNLENLVFVNNRESNDSVGAGPGHVVTLFAFKGSELSFSFDVSISTALELLIAFQKENLVNTGIYRDAWYGEPRRRERSERRLLGILEGE